jgi:CSLREA domain-containing protein
LTDAIAVVTLADGRTHVGGRSGRHSGSWFRVAAATAIVWSLLPVAGARAATIVVSTTADENGTGAECSLREAVRAANTNAPVGGCPSGSASLTDAIELRPGRYRLEVPREDPGQNEKDALKGDLDITQDVAIHGAGRAVTLVDANGGVTADRAFEIWPRAKVAMSGLTVQGGKTKGYGGGILLTTVELTLTGVSVSGNQAVSGGGGGGISAFTGSRVILSRSIVAENTADNLGGGIETFGQPPTTVILTDSVVSGNVAASFGGGVFSGANGILSVTRTTVRGNDAVGVGGGIYAGSGAPTTTISRSTISGNHSTGNAAGIASSGQLHVTNSTISGNRADGSGGGLETAGGASSADLVNVTIYRNVADADRDGTGDGGGLSQRFDPVISLMDTIVAGNLDAGGQAPDCFGSLSSAGYNIVGINTSCIPEPGGPGDLLGTATAPIDALVSPLASNGGSTETHALLPGSPAIDGGAPPDPSGPCGAGPRFDQRGVPRSLAGRCDVGAYELVRCFARPVDVVGTSEPETLGGSSRSEVFLALGGDDTVNAGGGDDRVCGGRGRDRLRGEGGSDLLAGQEASDSLDGGPGTDVCAGGPGTDTAVRCEIRRGI